jgi:hypothetical protein
MEGRGGAGASRTQSIGSLTLPGVDASRLRGRFEFGVWSLKLLNSSSRAMRLAAIQNFVYASAAQCERNQGAWRM